MRPQGEPLRDRAAAAQQDDGLHRGAERHGAHLLGPRAQARQAHDLAHGRGAYEGTQGSVDGALALLDAMHATLIHLL